MFRYNKMHYGAYNAFILLKYAVRLALTHLFLTCFE